MSFFAHLEEIPPDSIFGISKAFLDDKNPNKVDLTVGIYYNKLLRPEVLSSVQKAEHALCELENIKTYLPIDGDQFYLEATQKLLFGEELSSNFGSKIYAAQTVGGTGALRVAAETLYSHLTKVICIPEPTWPNHIKVFTAAKLQVKTYAYYDYEQNRCHFEKMLDSLKDLKPKTAVLLHGCCHNPSGWDLTKQQWKELSQFMLKKKLIPVFDVAYQGFGESLEEDAFPIRYFTQCHHEFFVCYSYSKIFGLYAERAGALFVMTENKQLKRIIGTHIRPIIRASYSNPPKHGSNIVSYVLHNSELKKQWILELEAMKNRVNDIKNDFCHCLCRKSKYKDYSYIQYLKGLFCLTGLTKTQVKQISEEHGIYMTYDGRVNLTGLNSDNIEYVTDIILKASNNLKKAS